VSSVPTKNYQNWSTHLKARVYNVVSFKQSVVQRQDYIVKPIDDKLTYHVDETGLSALAMEIWRFYRIRQWVHPRWKPQNPWRQSTACVHCDSSCKSNAAAKQHIQFASLYVINSAKTSHRFRQKPTIGYFNQMLLNRIHHFPHINAFWKSWTITSTELAEIHALKSLYSLYKF